MISEIKYHRWKKARTRLRRNVSKEQATYTLKDRIVNNYNKKQNMRQCKTVPPRRQQKESIQHNDEASVQ